MHPKLIKQLILSIRRVAENNSGKNLSFLIASSLRQQGTSAILKQADMQYIAIDENHDLNLFYNQQGLILEINQNIIQQLSIPLPIFVKKLNRCHHQVKISGFLFFIDIADFLINEHSVQNQAIKHHIQLMHSWIHALDYSVRSALFITKMDQITGFTEYFSMSHLYELHDALGFSLPSMHSNHQFSQRFHEIWSNFINHLNHGVIAKMHTTRGNQKRILIREFPLQIGLLETKFQHMLKNINHPKAQIHGLYFTCAEQNGKNINYLNQRIQNALPLVSPIPAMQSVNYRPYFIIGALKHCQDLATYTSKPHIWQDRKTMSILSSSILISLGMLWTAIHSHLMLQHTSVQLQLNWRQHKTYHQKLNALETCIINLQRIPAWFSHDEAIQRLRQQISHAEFNIYQKEMVSEIQGLLKQQMQNQDLYQRYQALKAYKILMTHKKQEQAFVLQWLEQHLEATDKMQQLALFKKMIWKVRWIPDETVMSSTQALLNALPVEYLAYQIIQATIHQKQQSISMPGFTPQTFLVPYGYTKAGFYKMQKALISGLQQYKQDNWILQQELPKDLEQKILNSYANQYVHYWKNINQKIKPIHFSSFDEAHQLFLNFEKHHSLEKLVQLVIRETSASMNQPHDVFNQKIASQFTTLQFAPNYTHTLQLFWRDLKKFSDTFRIIDNEGQASFQYLRSYFNQAQYNDSLYTTSEMAKHFPAPLNAWLSQIFDDIWLSLYQSTKNYLNQEWHQQVYQSYQQTLQNFYPFNPSGPELSINQFEDFFAPNGKIQQFYQKYLDAFINTNQAQWEPKIINDRQFNLKQTVIDQFIQSNVITNMFFPNNTHNTRIQFSLQKMALDPVIAQLKFNIGQQSLSDNQQENLDLQNIYWPQMNASLHIQTINGETFSIEENGYWGLFKLLQQVNVLADPNDASALQILLEINGNSGRYLLKTTTPLNPFTPGILNNFQLEEKIID